MIKRTLIVLYVACPFAGIVFDALGWQGAMNVAMFSFVAPPILIIGYYVLHWIAIGEKE